MNYRPDRGELLARAMTETIKAFEEWDTAQFSRLALPEWQVYMAKLLRLSQISLDFSKRK